MAGADFLRSALQTVATERERAQRGVDALEPRELEALRKADGTQAALEAFETFFHGMRANGSPGLERWRVTSRRGIYGGKTRYLSPSDFPFGGIRCWSLADDKGFMLVPTALMRLVDVLLQPNGTIWDRSWSSETSRQPKRWRFDSVTYDAKSAASWITTLAFLLDRWALTV